MADVQPIQLSPDPEPPGPRWVAPDGAWHGSYWCALFGLVALGAAMWSDPRPAPEQLRDVWQPLLMIAWLAAASFLIGWAYRLADTFEDQAKSLVGVSKSARWVDQRRLLRSVTLVPLTVAFVMGGEAVAAFVHGTAAWHTCWTIVVGTTFYYAGFGLWGAWVVTRSVVQVAEDALIGKRLELFHGDRLAGLGFAVKYADVASILLLTGSSALPMAWWFAAQALRMRTGAGNGIAILVGALVVTWTVFALLATLRARYVVVSVVDQFRAPILTDIARKKESLINKGTVTADLSLLEKKEQAAARLRSGILSGAGGWKDFFTVVASVLSAATEFVDKLPKMK